MHFISSLKMADPYEDIMKLTFEQACNYIKACSGNIDPPDLLYFYGRYKQVCRLICKPFKQMEFNNLLGDNSGVLFVMD